MVVTLKQILSENQDVILKNKNLYCHSCEITIDCKTKHQTTRLSKHLKSKAHCDNKKLKKKKNVFIDEALENNKTKNLFNFELTKALLQSGVGLNIVNSPPLKSFLETQMGKKLSDASTLRKNYLNDVYNEAINRIKQKIKDESLYFIIDETRDVYSRSIINILVGILDGKESKAMLYYTNELQEPANNANISKEFLNSLQVLFDNNQNYEKIWLVLSDQAKYMETCFENLKSIGIFPNMHHITCLAHCLHRVSEKICDLNPDIDLFIS
jgi:hypothetical protein